jgi:hypothetical protein
MADRPLGTSGFAHPEWRKKFQETRPALREKDIAGFGFSINQLLQSA